MLRETVTRLVLRALIIALSIGTAMVAYAGGPRYVAGSTYFDPSLKGKPVIWPGGSVTYFTDLGSLSSTVTNAQATATVDAAAAIWNVVSTAAVSIIRGGTLAEDVDANNVVASADGIVLPPDIQATAISRPVGVIFDADGAVIDALFGTDASDPNDCIDSGVMNIVDNLAQSGAIAHALILINGRCTGTAAQLEQIEFQLIRAFGRVIGLGWSQANDAVLSSTSDPSLQQLEGWPVMRPLDRNCNQLSTQCVPNPLQLRADDIASVSRLYPVTAANLAQFPGKRVTATATLSIHGSVYFRRGQGMQGIDVITRPVTPGVLLPDDRYPVAAVTGSLYTGDQGNPITGRVDSTGTSLSNFGSDDPLVEGFYDLSGIPLPPGASAADYELTLEPINALYTGSLVVGPYALGSPTPSGTLPSITLHGLTGGMSVEQDFAVPDSAGDLQADAGGTFFAPASSPVAGDWEGRVPFPGQTGWFAFSVLGGRHLTIETQALDEQDHPCENKLRAVIGIWDGSDPDGSPTVNATVVPFNGAAPGVTSLGVDAIANGGLLLAIADQRGDGRPDYTYRGRILYAAVVTPQRLPLSGGSIQILGSGFRPGMTVTLGTQIATTVTEISPTRILATAPANPSTSGSLDLVVHDPATNGSAVIAGGISYGDANGDTLSITTALAATLNVAASAPFTVRVFGPDQQTPVAGVPVSFTVLQGAVAFAGCSNGLCTVTTGGDGYATVQVTPASLGLIQLQASLTTGATLDAEFTGIASLAIVPVSASLFLAPDASLLWPMQVQVVSGEAPLSGVSIQWVGESTLAAQSGSDLTNTQGLASWGATVGPWAAGTQASATACITGTSRCATFAAFVVHPESENLVAVAGVAQSIQVGATPAAVVVRLVAPNGEPIAGGVVSFWVSIRAWTPVCAPGGRCAVGRLLSTAEATAVSDSNGIASFSPTVPAGIPVVLTGSAEAGTSAMQPFRVEIDP